jgi:hypothetical protein
MDSAMPSSMPKLTALGAMDLPDQAESLRTGLRYWAEETGLVTSLPIAGEVA